MPGIKPISNDQPIEQVAPLEMIKEPELDFDEIERQMGIMQIYLVRDQKMIANEQIKRDKEVQKGLLELYVGTSKQITPLLLTGLTCFAEAVSVLLLVRPEICPPVKSIFDDLYNCTNNNCLGQRFPKCDPLDLACLTKEALAEALASMSKTAQDSLKSASTIGQVVKQFFDQRNSATTYEAQSNHGDSRQRAEATAQKRQQLESERASAMEAFSRKRQQREDQEMGMAR